MHNENSFCVSHANARRDDELMLFKNHVISHCDFNMRVSSLLPEYEYTKKIIISNTDPLRLYIIIERETDRHRLMIKSIRINFVKFIKQHFAS